MPTVNDILDRFARDHVPTLSKRTQIDYRRHISVLRDQFGARDAEKLVADDFDEFMNVSKGRSDSWSSPKAWAGAARV
jgi:hypothetical protein